MKNNKIKIFIISLILMFIVSTILLLDMPKSNADVTHEHGTPSSEDYILFDKAIDSSFTSGTSVEGNYYLTEDVQLSNPSYLFIGSNKTVNICLCGHKLTLTSYEWYYERYAIKIEDSATLNIYDDSSNKGIIDLGEDGVIANKGTLNIYGGTIQSSSGSGRGLIESSKNVTIDEKAILNYNGSESVIRAGGNVTLKGTINATMSDTSESIFAGYNNGLNIYLYNSFNYTSNNSYLFDLYNEPGDGESKIYVKDTLTGNKKFIYHVSSDETSDGLDSTIIYKDTNNHNTFSELYNYFLYKSYSSNMVQVQDEDGNLGIKNFKFTKEATLNDLSVLTTFSDATYEWYKASRELIYLTPDDFESSVYTTDIQTEEMAVADYDETTNEYYMALGLEVELKEDFDFDKLLLIAKAGTYQGCPYGGFSTFAYNDIKIRIKCNDTYITDQNADQEYVGTYDATNNYWYALKEDNDFSYLSVSPSASFGSYTNDDITYEILEDIILYEITPTMVDENELAFEHEYVGKVLIANEIVTLNEKANDGKTLTCTDPSYYICKATASYSSIYSHVIDLRGNVLITETAQTKTFNGNKQGFTITGNVTTGFTVKYKINDVWTSEQPKNVGTYDIKITRNEDDNYYLYEKTILNGLKITKGQAVISIAKDSYDYYLGDAIILPKATTSLGSVACDTLVSSLNQVGTYTLTYIVLGNDNFNGATKTITVNIKPKKNYTIHSEIEDDTTPLVEATSTNGFDQDIKIVATITLKDNLKDTNFLVDYNKIKDKTAKIKITEQLGFVYDVKLVKIDGDTETIINIEDLGNDATVKLKLLLPDDINKSQIKRILHVDSTGNIKTLSYNSAKIDDNGYYVMEVDNLNEIAFIMKDNTFYIWILIISIVLLIITAFIIIKYIWEHEYELSKNNPEMERKLKWLDKVFLPIYNLFNGDENTTKQLC